MQCDANLCGARGYSTLTSTSLMTARVHTCARQAAEGDHNAQYTLGAALMRGQLGLQKNTKEASEWLLKAADAGNLQYELLLP